MTIPSDRRNGRAEIATPSEMSIPKGYGDIAHEYRAAGWQSVLPLPPGKKSSPPEGFTGYNGRVPDDTQVERWCAERPPNANVALRLPDGVVAIDVDNYGGKRGLATLAKFEADAGCKFPPTWSSTARGDGSGQRFYRVPTGQAWPGKLPGSGVELLQAGHRYAMAYPSLHPNGNVVRWYDPSGEISNDVPRLEDLTELPAPLAHALVNGATVPTQKASRAEGSELLKGLAAGAPSPAVLRTLAAAIQCLDGEDGSRFDAVRDRTAALIRLGANGEPGVPTALSTLRSAYVAVLGPVRGVEVAADEFDRFVAGGGQLIAADRVLFIAQATISQAFAPGGSWHRDTPYPGQDREALRARGLLDAEGNAVQRRPRFARVSARELAKPIPPMEWLIRGVWPRNSFGPWAGARKTLKSYNLLALTVALASGKPMLGEFEVATAGPVLYFVGEGGEEPFQRRLQAMARAYGVDLAELPIDAVFDVASLTSTEFTDAVKAGLDEMQPALVILDPLYAFHPTGVEAQNLYARGPMLAELSGLIGGEAALIVADHFNKTGAGGLDLDSISQAGVGQWADSWGLQQHREPPDLAAGEYRLGVEFGSRQWGGARYEIDWTLPAVGELESGEATAPGISWAVRRAGTEGARPRGGDRVREAIEQTLRDHPFELSKTALLGAVGGKKEATRAAIEQMISEGRVIGQQCERAEGSRTVKRTLFGLQDPVRRVRLDGGGGVEGA